MQLTLVLPDLPTLHAHGTTSVRTSAFACLLASAGLPVRESGGIPAALAPLYGVERQADWPLAAIRVAALGIDPGTAFWLAADPVTLDVGRDDVRLLGVVEDLGRADADRLLASLNMHFAADGLTFLAPEPDMFFARTTNAPRMTTHPPAAPGQPSRTLLPEGPDANIWRRWQSEIQMLLHEHPVNAERERSGRALANSLWFSYGGTLPPGAGPELSIRTFATAGIAVALAAFAGSPARALPSSLADALGAAGAAEMVIVALDRSPDWEAAQRSWIAPAKDALDAGLVGALSLLADDLGDVILWRARRARLWRRLAGRYARHDLDALLWAARKDV